MENGVKKGISGNVLKIIAVLSMLVDHTAATILERMLIQMPLWGPINNRNYDQYYNIYQFLRSVGRMAFPIYCFLLVEGFVYTKNRAKYALRLFLFALLSEVPFDMAFRYSFFDMSYNNVFFTLWIGLLTIMAVDFVRKKIGRESDSGARALAVGAGKVLLIALVLLVGCVAADPLLHTDYGAAGVIAIFLIYVFREHRMTGFALAVLALTLLSSETEIVALLMLVPLYCYNGTRGRQIKYFFYAFYPVHLLILSLICFAIGLGI